MPSATKAKIWEILEEIAMTLKVDIHTFSRFPLEGKENN